MAEQSPNVSCAAARFWSAAFRNHFDRLDIVLRHPFARSVTESQIELAKSVILFGRFAIPFHRLGRIPRHAGATIIAEAQIGLRPREVLFGGFAEPLRCLGVILRHAFATVVTNSQIVLSLGQTLLGGFAIPLRRFDQIPRHPFAFVVATSELKLRFRLTAFSLCLDFRDRSLCGGNLFRERGPDRGTAEQEKKAHQPIRFHLGKLVGSSRGCRYRPSAIYPEKRQ